MASPFRSLQSNPAKVQWTKEKVVSIARQLLEEHAAAREAATLAANRVCGNCSGSGNVDSLLMPGELTKCWACAGTGQPNDKITSLPELTPQDNERMWKLSRLVQSEHGAAVLKLIRETFPEMYRDSDGPAN